jgi:hypothetical protein
MTAADMLEDTFPHGTVRGYDQGCRTNHCPAPITCTVFRTRYVSDWGFRKRVDAGWTAEEIADWDAREAAKAVEAERAAREAEKVAQRAEAARARRKQAPRKVRANAFTEAEYKQIRDMNAEGATDAAIAEALGRNASVITKKRDGMGLPRDSRKAVRGHGTRAGYDAGCRDDSCPNTPTCSEAARVEWRASAEAKRRREGRPERAPVEVAALAEAKRLFDAGDLGVGEIAKRVGISRHKVARHVNPTGERRLRSHCSKGHEFTPENTYINERVGSGRRFCKQCRRDEVRARRAAAA